MNRPSGESSLMTQAEYRRGFDNGMRQGIGHAIHLLMEAGVPPEQHDALHQWIDAWEIAHGNLKREPRAGKYQEGPK